MSGDVLEEPSAEREPLLNDVDEPRERKRARQEAMSVVESRCRVQEVWLQTWLRTKQLMQNFLSMAQQHLGHPQMPANFGDDPESDQPIGSVV